VNVPICAGPIVGAGLKLKAGCGGSVVAAGTMDRPGNSIPPTLVPRRRVI